MTLLEEDRAVIVAGAAKRGTVVGSAHGLLLVEWDDTPQFEWIKVPPTPIPPHCLAPAG